MSENPRACDFYGSSAGFDTSVNETEYLIFLILHLWRKQDGTVVGNEQHTDIAKT